MATGSTQGIISLLTAGICPVEAPEIPVQVLYLPSIWFVFGFRGM